MRIRGKGAPKVKGTGNGDLRITLHVEVPTHMTPQQEQAMIDFQAATELAGENVRAAFEQLDEEDVPWMIETDPCT